MYTQKHTFRVSKIVRAPLSYTYDWCTDFRETDPKLTGSKNKRRMLFRTKHRVVYVSQYMRRGQLRDAINVVTLYPKKFWHLDFHGDEDDETGEYALARLDAKRTRLKMTFTEAYKIRNAPTKAADIKHTNEIWNKYVATLEKDYARARRR